MKPFTRRLRMLRAERGLSQRVTSIRAGIPYSRYMNIENGFRIPTVGELGKIARVLGATTEALTAALEASVREAQGEPEPEPVTP